MRLRGDPYRSELKIDIAPEEERHLLLAESGEQKSGEKLPLAIGGDFEKRCQFLLGVLQGQRRYSLREMKQSGQARPSVSLAELSNDHDVVENGVRRHPGFHQGDHIIVKLLGRNRIEGSSIEDLGESRQHSIVFPVGVGLFQSLDLVEVSVDQLANCGRLSRSGDVRGSIPRGKS